MYKFIYENGQLVIEPKDELFMYVRYNHGGQSLNTQKRYAQVLRKFIGNMPINELDTEYAANYIRRRAHSGIDRKTHEFETYVIKDFMSFLEERGTIEEMDPYGFDGLPKAPHKISKKINDINPQYLKLFLETALYYQPRIAFMLVLLILGGLRPSEALNLSKSAISCIGPWGKDGWIVDIKNRELRENFTPSCKKPRQQKVQSIGDLGAKLYKNHMEKYVGDDNPALFIGENGEAMTYEAFYKRFKRLKKHFIESLRASIYPEDIAYANFLEERRWGGHIGRGIFSNDLARNTANIAEIAGARGDGAPASPIPYLQAGAVDRHGTLQQYIADEILND